MIRDEFAGVTALLTVADKRSFTAAAAVLRVTPSALSQSVRALEQRVGVQLLARTTRSVGLTDAGARLLASLRPAVDDVRAAFGALDAVRDRPSGTLKLNVSRIAGEFVLGPALGEFLAAYPEVSVEVTVDDGLADIVKGGFDAGVRLGETLERDMVGVRISGDERVAVVGSPAYFARRGKPKHPRDLHAHECVGYRQVTSGRVYRWEFTVDGRDVEIAVPGRLLVNDAAMMVRAALDGVGLAHVLESTVRRELAEKKLARVLEAYCPPFPGFYLYYPRQARMAPKLRALVDFVKKRAPRRAGTERATR